MVIFMRKLVIFGDYSPYLPAIRDRLPGWEVAGGDGADVLPHLETAEVSFGAVIPTPEQFARAKNLKWMQVVSAGAELMPLAGLEARDIWLTTANGVHAFSISESVFGMMLSFSRQLFNIRDRQSKRIWRDNYDHLGGFTEIHGKTLGLIGVGAIGKETARLAKAFGMTVLGYRRTGEQTDYVDEMFGGDTLRDMLSRCDYVVNSLPATPFTEKMIGAAEFAAMRNSAYYITVGRGVTTDTGAIIDAINSGQIRGAGLDVVDPEPLPADSPLWDMPNVFIGSHQSGGTDRYDERAVGIFLSNLEDYLAGKAPGRNLVNYKLGY
jgi:phosphoglycerate dehydrogenase-like enzyme